MKTHALLVGALLFTSTLVWSCKNSKDEAVADCNATLPASISYSRDIQPIFTQHCAGSSCHTGPSPAAGLDLGAANSYAELTASGSGYVNVANPTSSILYSRMNSTSQPMPPNGRLGNCSVESVLKWIEQGAANN